MLDSIVLKDFLNIIDALIEDFCCDYIIYFIKSLKNRKMPFFYFTPTTFPLMQSLETYQNYNNSMSNYVSTYPANYYQFFTWNNNPQFQTYSVEDLKLNLNHLTTTDDCSQSQIIVQMENNSKNFKNREKKTAQKQISSAKKNSQSNIINQFYSFFGCRQKSQKIALKAIQATLSNAQFQEKILTLFYNTIRAINSKRGRKYVNRAMMLNYFTPDMLIQNLPEIKQKLEKLCQIFRRCCQAFLKIVSIPAILTSKRITGISKEEHFKKRRKILKAITGY